MNHTFIIPCLFGLESYVADEIRRLGYEARSENGRVRFLADLLGGARANLFLRTGERVLLLLAEFPALSFTELFDKVKEIPWEEFIPKDGRFPVKGHSLRSKLYSVPDCQSIIKKAVVERLKARYKTDWFEESGALYQIQFSIMKDTVAIMLDLSGEGLHKRGYRKNANEAPLRETLAAAICDQARQRRGDLLLDPLCGSGTIVIEAAMRACRMAPGLNRRFSAENWGFFPKENWQYARQEGLDLIDRTPFTISASDIDPRCVELTRENAKKAGVGEFIAVKQADVRQLPPSDERGLIITNPPYGERLLEQDEARALYRDMGAAFLRRPNFKYFVLSSDEQFESFFGKKADKKRKLYNGMIKCDLYQYFKK